TPVPAHRPLAMPTPRIDPISVCELLTGSPLYQVPKFQITPASSSASTMTSAASGLVLMSASTGSRWTMLNATAAEPMTTVRSAAVRVWSQRFCTIRPAGRENGTNRPDRSPHHALQVRLPGRDLDLDARGLRVGERGRDGRRGGAAVRRRVDRHPVLARHRLH